jgi:hypothetical protein
MGILNLSDAEGQAEISVAANRGGVYYTGITQELLVCKPDGSTYSITLHDDGGDGDITQGDGIYTGRIDVDKTGLYVLKSRAKNEAASAQEVLRRGYDGTPYESTPTLGDKVYDYFDINSEIELFVVDKPQSTVPDAASGIQQNKEASGGGCNAGTLALGLLLISAVALIAKSMKYSRSHK